MGRAGVSGTATGVDRSELEVMAGAWLCHPPPHSGHATGGVLVALGL